MKGERTHGRVCADAGCISGEPTAGRPGIGLSGRGAGRERRVWGETDFEGFSLLSARYLDHRFALHSHDTYVIGTNLRGTATCFDDPAKSVSPGSLLLLHPGEPHGGRRLSNEPWVYLAAYPSRAFLRDLLEELTGRSNVEPEFPRLIYRDRAAVHRFVRSHDVLLLGNDPLYAESAMVDFLTCLLRSYCVPGRSPPLTGASVVIDRSIEYIRDNLEEPLSLEALAHASGYSKSYFLRQFKKRTGQTPHAFVMQQRVERAKELLARGLPIASSAFDAGFADQAHLTRRFKRLVGVTPGEFVRGQRPPRAPAASRCARRRRRPEAGAHRPP